MAIRGYCGIGIVHSKKEVNVGTLWRSAYQLGAAFVFTIGRRYSNQASDTCKAWRHIPLLHYGDVDDFLGHVPHSCSLVAVEMGGVDLATFEHPERCVYLLGAEDSGLPEALFEHCQATVSIAAERIQSYNVAVAGSIVLYDRLVKGRLLE